VTQIMPQSAGAGQIVTISGKNFSATIKDNHVRIGGVTAVVSAASENELRVIIPECIAPGKQSLVVSLGGTVTGAARTIDLSGTPPAPFAPTIDQPVVMNGAQHSCLALVAGEYLLLVQNASVVGGRQLPLELALGSSPTASTGSRALPEGARTPHTSFSPIAVTMTAAPVLTDPPPIGHSRTFNTGWLENSLSYVTATLQLASAHALIYVDQSAAEIYTAGQLEQLADLFDNVIYPWNASVFGEATDVDRNGRVVMLFTPAVNRLTPSGSATTLVGFTSSCDIEACRGTNTGEILYIAVPDANGRYGKALKGDSIFRSIPRTVAHELVHVIQFGQRFISLRAALNEEQWLAEGMAHQAEEMLAQYFESVGDVDLAHAFRDQNHKRAALFMANVGRTGLIESTGTGSAAERGAQWLFLNYLSQRYGTGLMQRLTQTSLRGTANVARATGVDWATLLADWALTIYSDAAAGGARAGDGPASTSENPLQVSELSLQRPYVSQTLMAGATQFVLLKIDGVTAANLSITDLTGRAPSTDAQLVVRRIR
jgi:hypothetical protein